VRQQVIQTEGQLHQQSDLEGELTQ
jgi:hypothetical protein